MEAGHGEGDEKMKNYRLPMGWVALLLGSIALPGCGGSDIPAMTVEQLEALRARSISFENQQAEELIQDAMAMALGEELFAGHCARCHGIDARAGVRGAPDLVQGVFDYGDSLEAIRQTITHGRHSIMPGQGGKMGEVDMGALVAYVRAMATGEDSGLFHEVGERLYTTHCVACHGPEGKGNLLLGASDLTDDYWQHGGAMMSVRLVTTHGVESQCPAQEENLTAIEIELLTAHVLNLRTSSGAP